MASKRPPLAHTHTWVWMGLKCVKPGNRASKSGFLGGCGWVGVGWGVSAWVWGQLTQRTHTHTHASMLKRART